MALHVVSSENLSSFNLSNTNVGDDILVRTDPKDATTQIAHLEVINANGTLGLLHKELYHSTTEFATLTMKQSLTLYVKRRVIEKYPKYYSKDDPRVHSYVSRLSYEGIKYVATHINEFAEQFHSGHILLKIPKSKSKPKSK